MMNQDDFEIGEQTTLPHGFVPVNGRSHAAATRNAMLPLGELESRAIIEERRARNVGRTFRTAAIAVASLLAMGAAGKLAWDYFTAPDALITDPNPTSINQPKPSTYAPPSTQPTTYLGARR